MHKNMQHAHTHAHTCITWTHWLGGYIVFVATRPLLNMAQLTQLKHRCSVTLLLAW